jgi:hypothetical protein
MSSLRVSRNCLCSPYRIEEKTSGHITNHQFFALPHTIFSKLRENIRDVQKDDFELKGDSKGLRYVRVKKGLRYVRVKKGLRYARVKKGLRYVRVKKGLRYAYTKFAFLLLGISNILPSLLS